MSQHHQTQKAQKAVIHLGDIPLDVYQMPDGSYRLSKTDVGRTIDKARNSLLRFVQGKSAEALPYKDLPLLQVQHEGYHIPIDAVPIEAAIAYWRYWDKKGNPKAGAIITACINESIERRADDAFGIARSEEERQERFAQHLTPEAIAKQQELELQNRNLELRLQLAQTNSELIDKSQAIADKHGVSTLALIMGHPNAVVERRNPSEGVMTPVLEKILEISRRRGAVSVREFQNSYSGKYRPKADKIREWFKELASLGYGSLEQKGRSLKFTAYLVADD